MLMVSRQACYWPVSTATWTGICFLVLGGVNPGIVCVPSDVQRGQVSLQNCNGTFGHLYVQRTSNQSMHDRVILNYHPTTRMFQGWQS